MILGSVWGASVPPIPRQRLRVCAGNSSGLKWICWLQCPRPGLNGYAGYDVSGSYGAPAPAMATCSCRWLRSPCSCCWLRRPRHWIWRPQHWKVGKLLPWLQHGGAPPPITTQQSYEFMVPSRVNHLPMWPVRLGNPQNQIDTIDFLVSISTARFRWVFPASPRRARVLF
jgi:hypothetical protein